VFVIRQATSTTSTGAWSMSSSRTWMTKPPTSTKRNRVSKAPVGHRRRERKRIRRASVLLLKSEGKAHPHSGSPFIVGWEPDERVEGYRGGAAGRSLRVRPLFEPL